MENFSLRGRLCPLDYGEFYRIAGVAAFVGSEGVLVNSKERRPQLYTLLASLSLFFSVAVTAVHSQTLEELHQNALKEGGTVNFYDTLAQITAAKILAVFEKTVSRYAGKPDRCDPG